MGVCVFPFAVSTLDWKKTISFALKPKPKPYTLKPKAYRVKVMVPLCGTTAIGAASSRAPQYGPYYLGNYKCKDLYCTVRRPIWWFPKMREPQYRPQTTVVLIIGTPKKWYPHFRKLPYQVFGVLGSLDP